MAVSVFSIGAGVVSIDFWENGKEYLCTMPTKAYVKNKENISKFLEYVLSNGLFSVMEANSLFSQY